MITLADGSVAWFGTDAVGRDVAKQVIYGARISLVILDIVGEILRRRLGRGVNAAV